MSKREMRWQSWYGRVFPRTDSRTGGGLTHPGCLKSGGQVGDYRHAKCGSTIVVLWRPVIAVWWMGEVSALSMQALGLAERGATCLHPR